MSILLLARLSRNFENLLLNSDNNHDMIINVGNEPNCKTFYAHSLILTSQSKYFQTALSNDWVKRDEDKIIFDKPNISPIIFEIILKHLYCGTVALDELTPLELLDLLSSTDEFMLPELMNFAESHLLSLADSWVKNDLIKIYLFTQKIQECKNLQEFCEKKICENPELIFNSNDFTNLSEEILINLLKRDDLATEEVVIWEHVIRWGTHKCSNDLSKKDVNEWKKENFDELWEIVKNLVELIRFNDITSLGFSSAVRPYSSMFPREKYETLLWNYITPQTSDKPSRKKKFRGFGLVQTQPTAVFGSSSSSTTTSTPTRFTATTTSSGFGFGPTTSTSTRFVGFGNPTTTTPTTRFVGFGNPSTTAGSGFVGFGSSSTSTTSSRFVGFGNPSTTTTSSGFVGFGRPSFP